MAITANLDDLSHSSVEALSERVQTETGTDQFIMTGGNVIDPLVGGTLNLSDIDLVFETEGREHTMEQIGSLASHGFEIDVDESPYFIEETEPADIAVAKKGELCLDLAFVRKQLLAVGPLDAISMYYDPEAGIVDDYGCMDALESKVFGCLPGKSYNNENPYVIFGRLLYACVKYDAPLSSQTELIDGFNKAKIDYALDTPFRERSRDSLLRKHVRAVFETPYRMKLIREIIDSDVLAGPYDKELEALNRAVGLPDVSERVLLADSSTALQQILFNPPQA